MVNIERIGNFCYFIDDNDIQYNMMKKSIETLIITNKISQLYILFYKRNKNIIIEDIKKISMKHKININFDVIEVNDQLSRIIKLPKNALNQNYLKYNSLSRFFIPYYIPIDSIYYVDNDILFNKSIYDDIINHDHNKLMIAYEITNYGKRSGMNAGFLYINCKKWKESSDIMFNILSYYNDHHESIKWMNQDCYKWLIQNKYKNECQLIYDEHMIINQYMYDPGIKTYHILGDKNNKIIINEFNKLYNIIINQYKEIKLNEENCNWRPAWTLGIC